MPWREGRGKNLMRRNGRERDKAYRDLRKGVNRPSKSSPFLFQLFKIYFLSPQLVRGDARRTMGVVTPERSFVQS